LHGGQQAQREYQAALKAAKEARNQAIAAKLARMEAEEGQRTQRPAVQPKSIVPASGTHNFARKPKSAPDLRAGLQALYEGRKAGEAEAAQKPWWQRAWKRITTAAQNVVNTVSGAVAGILHPPQKTGSYKPAAPVKDDDPPWWEKITNAVGQAWDVTKTTTISAWNLTKTIATDFGNLVVETGKSLAYSFNQIVVPKLNSVFVSAQKALLSAWDDTKNVFIGIKNDIASIPFAIKDAAKENIPIAAEWLYQNRTVPIITFAEKHPLGTKIVTQMLNLVINSEKEKMRPFTDTNPESMAI